MSQATRHLEESFRQVAPSLMLDVLLFLGGKRVAGNPTASDFVQSTPKTKTKPQVRLGERDEILDTLNKKPDIKLLGEAGGIQDLTTGTVWDNITPTQNFYPNTKIPKSFEIKVNGQKIWVHGNATEHIYEDVYAKHIKEFGTAYTNPDLYTQQLVSDFYGSLEYVMVSGIEYGHIISAGNWDFIFVPPREKELLPVIKHAQFKGWK